jgi:PAS domain S-box-containing protein
MIAQRLDLIYRATPYSNLISLVAACTGFVIFWWHGPSWQLIVWLLLLLTVAGIRQWAYVCYQRAQEHVDWSFWWHVMLVLAVLHGLAWGLIALHPFDRSYAVAAMLFPMIVGIGALNAYGPTFQTYALFVASMFSTLMLGAVWFNQVTIELLILPTCLIGLMLSGLGKIFEGRVLEQCEMQRELRRLNATLQESNASLRREIAERERTEHALVESEARFRRMADTAPIMIWMMQHSRSAMELNRQTQAFLGVHTARIDSDVWCSAIHPEDRERCQAVVREALARNTSFEREYRLCNAEGEYRWVVERGLARFAPDGRFVGYIGTCTDITEHRQAEMARLEHAIAQRSVLIREVHHRIKNHLQGLLALMERLEAKCPAAAGLFQEAASQTQVIATIHGLQAQSALTLPTLNAVLQAIVTNLQHLTTVPIVYANDGTLEASYMDEHFSVAVALVLNELLLNAVKHGRFDGPGARIEVMLRQHAEAWDVVLRNPGRLSAPADGLVNGSMGLSLVRLLLPSSGAVFELTEVGEMVEATLRLSSPVLTTASSTVPGSASNPKSGAV